MKLYNVIRNPIKAILAITACVLLIFGIYVIIPWTAEPDASGSYPNVIVRSLFGVLMCWPAMTVIYRLQHNILKARRSVFWMGVTYLYLSMLNGLVRGWLPPMWILLFAFGVISMLLWVTIE